MLDLSTDTAADLHPKIHLISDGEFSGQLHRDAVRTAVIPRNAPDQEAAVVRSPIAHHIFALAFFHICRCKVTVEHLRQMIEILRVNGGTLAMEIMVDRLAIGMHNRCDILGALHASLDFQRINARIKQLRDEFDRIQIARREKEVPSRLPKYILSIGIDQCIGQTTGLRTAPAIAAAAADHAAHQTLPRVADAERAMYE